MDDAIFWYRVYLLMYYSLHKTYWKHIEDTYSFAVNTINIVIECNENINIFTRWKFLWNSLKKSKFSFYFIVYTPMRVSDVITNVTKQNLIVMVSTCEMLERQKQKC